MGGAILAALGKTSALGGAMLETLGKIGSGPGAVFATLGKTGAWGGAVLTEISTSGASTGRGRRTTVARRRSIAAIVAAIMVSIRRPIGGGVLAWGAGARGRRGSASGNAGENGGESLSPRSGAWYMRLCT